MRPSILSLRTTSWSTSNTQTRCFTRSRACSSQVVVSLRRPRINGTMCRSLRAARRNGFARRSTSDADVRSTTHFLRVTRAIHLLMCGSTPPTSNPRETYTRFHSVAGARPSNHGETQCEHEGNANRWHASRACAAFVGVGMVASRLPSGSAYANASLDDEPICRGPSVDILFCRQRGRTVQIR